MSAQPSLVCSIASEGLDALLSVLAIKVSDVCLYTSVYLFLYQQLGSEHFQKDATPGYTGFT